MTGWHWAAGMAAPRAPYVNIPYWPHRIIVIGWGRLGRDGRMRRHRPCCYRMRLSWCCAGHRGQRAKVAA